MLKQQIVIFIPRHMLSLSAELCLAAFFACIFFIKDATLIKQWIIWRIALIPTHIYFMHNVLMFFETLWGY